MPPSLVTDIHIRVVPGVPVVKRHSILLVVALFLAMVLCLGQAISVAWLSASPAQASYLPVLRSRFWTYILLAVLCGGVSGCLLYLVDRKPKGAVVRAAHRLE